MMLLDAAILYLVDLAGLLSVMGAIVAILTLKETRCLRLKLLVHCCRHLSMRLWSGNSGYLRGTGHFLKRAIWSDATRRRKLQLAP